MPAKNLGPFTGRQLTTIIVAVIAAIAIPTAAYAVAATHVVIQDQTTKTPAGVTPTGNLKVAEAAPSAFFQNNSTTVTVSSGWVPVATPSAGSALIVTTIHVDTFYDPTPGNGQNVLFFIKTGTSCTGSQVGTYYLWLNPGMIGETDIPLAPGLGIPAGDALCALGGGSLQAEVSVSGYTVPAGTVAAGALHPIQALPKQR
jgi:hypothetical protein